MSLARFVDPGQARIVDREREALETAFDVWGDPLEVFLPVAGDEATVEHGLGRIPDGYLPILVVGGNVRASRVQAWTETTAYLVADANNVRAIILFVTCRKEIRNA